MGVIGRSVVRTAAWAAGVYYRLERAGPGLPDGPVLIVTNHPNMLMDPLLALRVAGRRVRVLAKAPLFEIPLFGQVLRSVGTLPLYRVQDDPEQLYRNRLAFEEAVDVLRGGGALLTFPEGGSRTSPALGPLKTGAARVALAAEEESDWRLGVKIVPLGLTYHRKHRFRSRVVAGTGAPIVVAEWRCDYESDRLRAVRSLTEAVAQGLERQTLNLADESDRQLVETAELLYARSKGSARPRQRLALGERLPQMRRFAELFAWLRVSDPERYEQLDRSLRDYARSLERLGSGEADVPPRYEVGPVVRYILRQAAVLGLGLPLAALAAIAWYVPYFVSNLVCRLIKPEIEMVATTKLLAGIIAYPAAYLAWIFLAGKVAGPAAAALTALALPLLGFVALAWIHRREEVWEDVKLFFQVVHRPRLRERLAEQRADLATRLDALSAEWSEALAERRCLEGSPGGESSR
ncbi:MAG: 1-acyl-sn-glycerol-3-phosphate acyltransferase [Gemmatimonadota bacterium]|nr:MAG: 1-acyl-sn-glycerol-3-phosphate acyltransferase [Gemmatimonadota bacterium]